MPSYNVNQQSSFSTLYLTKTTIYNNTATDDYFISIFQKGII